eukprot:CAMPEP_0183533942 /NCGR_PEP_ID=MMETSP0371-20130417/26538_1 /TAXON_ID=268820 /ORGANISM="Peridinium aciculiferum, Strain PAER-2" /LENGTH=127 /DNA_ID=CAMNT_0025734241 /DNA_START=330 /DNA_END=712 /DNA_ORIENTATION=-
MRVRTPDASATTSTFNVAAVVKFLALLPQRQARLAILRGVAPWAMLPAVQPIALVAPAVGPHKYTETPLLVPGVLPSEAATPGPSVVPDAVDLALRPLAFETPAIACIILAAPSMTFSRHVPEKDEP